MSAMYRCVVIEVDLEFFHVELHALSDHLAEIGLPPVAVYDPAEVTYCTRCREFTIEGSIHLCPVGAVRVAGSLARS